MSTQPDADTSVADLLRRGMLHHREGRLPEAERLYRLVLRRDPSNVQGLHLLGTIAGQQGDLGAALELLSRAASADPDNAHLLNNLGETLRHLGRNSEAIHAFRRAVVLQPTLWTAWTNAADAAKAEIGRAEAEGRAAEAARLRKFAGEWLEALGDRYWRERWGAKAEGAYREAIALDPTNVSAHNELGMLLRVGRRLADAEGVLRQALLIQPDLAETHNNLGTVLATRGDDEGARAAFMKALALKPNLREAADNLANSSLLGLVYLDDSTPETIFQAHQDWGRRITAQFSGAGRKLIPTFANSRDSERRLRVGYLSPDFRKHSVSYFFEPLLAAHDAAAVETFCYADVARPDETTRRLEKLAQNWRIVTGCDDAAIQRQIQADAIDVLVELAGHTGGTRLTVLAPKPAPVTVNWLGYPATTGLPTVDYRFTDAEADPPGASDRLHTEELVRLPEGFLCYQPPADAPPIVVTPARKQGFITFGSFNNPRKVASHCFDVWAAILAEIPTARLLLKGTLFIESETRKRFEDEFAKRGIGHARVAFRGWVSTAEHLGGYGDVDIGLDTFPYNGTTTTCEALWMGVPVIVLRGTHHAARVGTSLLSRIGLQELIGNNADEYVEKAVTLAKNLERLQALRVDMRNRMSASPLMDGSRFARRFEAALREIWRRWCRSTA